MQPLRLHLHASRVSPVATSCAGGMTDRSTDHWLGRHYHAAHIAGPVHFLNPTTRLLGVQGPQKQHHHEDGEGEKHSTTPSSSSESDSRQQHVGGVYNVWRSRDNRKGRHALALMPSVADGSNNKSNVNVKSQKPTNTLSATLMGIVRMVTRYPVWDVSYDVAVIFTIGSVSENTSDIRPGHGKGKAKENE